MNRPLQLEREGKKKKSFTGNLTFSCSHNACATCQLHFQLHPRSKEKNVAHTATRQRAETAAREGSCGLIAAPWLRVFEWRGQHLVIIHTNKGGGATLFPKALPRANSVWNEWNGSGRKEASRGDVPFLVHFRWSG